MKANPYKFEMARATKRVDSIVKGYLAVHRYRLLDTGMIQHSLALESRDPAGRGHRYAWQSTSRMSNLEAFVTKSKADGFGVTIRRKPRKVAP